MYWKNVELVYKKFTLHEKCRHVLRNEKQKERNQRNPMKTKERNKEK